MKSPKRINVAIDGTSSSGKSTMAKALAQAVGYTYIDSGAMYRAVTLFCIENGMVNGNTIDEDKLRSHLRDIKIEFRKNKQGVQETFLNGRNVEQAIRGLEVSNLVSPVAAIPFVRHELVAQQRRMGKAKGVVMDGRDIGTTVFPDAEIKVFVTSSAEVRAQRRFNELRAKGDTSVTLDDIIENVKMRDHIDSTRTESPLRKAPDAVELDSTPLTLEEQNQWIIDYFNSYFDKKRR
ncbi:MAG: (d)CMP kinase [Muribaculaceae bacterium]|nr:(d)CMP kinase [Muribaculaceae bacterium]